MKTKLILWTSLAGILCSANIYANGSNNSVGAEASHFIGNAVIASATTVLVDKYAPKVKRPAFTGFVVSASGAVAGETIDRMKGGEFSVLDVAVGTLGAAAGAYLTDRWYVQPRVETAKKETTYGVMVSRRF